MSYTRIITFKRPSTAVNWYCTWDTLPDNIKTVINSYKDSGKIIEYNFSGEDTTSMISSITFSSITTEENLNDESVIASFKTDRNAYNSNNGILCYYD